MYVTMTTIFYADPELVIAHGQKVIFLNPNDLQIFKEIELPADLTTCGLTLTESNAEEPTATAAADAKSTKTVAELNVQHVSYSPDRQLVALTTAGQKALMLYKSRPEHAQLLSVRALARASSALKFADDGSSVLVTDKTGDCYQYDCVDVQAAPRLLLGHLSIVYDILWTPDKKYIITCDRDDKIRVTNYPATYDIHIYCLGHREFVSGLALLTGQDIVSVSGDKTLCVWNYFEGKLLLQHELPAPAVRLQLRVLEAAKSYQLAVLFYDHSDAIGLYTLQRDSADNWTVKCDQLIRADAGDWIISNFVVTPDRIYVTGALDERLVLRAYNSADGAVASSVPAGWLEMVVEQFAGQACVPEDLSVWFKKRFDNVSEYMERKKRRIEEQTQQKC